MAKQRIVSGIRATGKQHIGNYLGALKQFVELQNSGDYDCYFFIADLHALTTITNPKELQQNTREVVAEYLASGLDPKKSVLFVQSHLPEHAELAWVFNCITPLAELERMTQYKDKVREQHQNVNAGLLAYPSLMAADILIYKPNFVPVGDDQMQHLELTRLVARKFNKLFGQTFPEPKNITLNALRLKSLKNPEKKMSKTGDEPLYMDDLPETILKKLKGAVTASEGNNKSPGVENLFYLAEIFSSPETVTKFKTAQKEGRLKFSELKEQLAQDISSHFATFREKKKAILSDPKKIHKILEDGAEKARVVARETLAEVKTKLGLL